MNIEHVSSKDVDILKEIARKAIIESVDVSDELKKEIISGVMNNIDNYLSNTECVFLKYTDTEIIGFILIKEYWNLSDLFVLPNSHGKGIGKDLFEKAKCLCKPKNNKGSIQVNSSKNAEGFYRNIGFESFATKKEQPSSVVPLIYTL